jgi:anhydro-N-acetylmuramic acid kinase
VHGLPGNVPSCTGAAGPRVLGRVTPAPDGGLPPAGRLAAWPTALSITGLSSIGLAGEDDTR